MSVKYKEKLYKLNNLLQSEQINLEELQAVCLTGIPDNENLRPLCWRLMLDYLPRKRSDFDRVLKTQRERYSEFVQDLIIDCQQQSEQACNDHPLNPNPDSAWSMFFEDNQVLSQIDKDVRRLCPEISFFQQATQYPCAALTGSRSLCQRVADQRLESQIFDRGSGQWKHATSRKVAVEQYARLADGQEAHWQVLERILFIYYKLNPGVKYVQGMNEILGPLYYVLASDPAPEWQKFAEADAFFCFQNLMSEIKDNFIKTLDRSTCGIDSVMTKLLDLLSLTDPELHKRLIEEQCIRGEFFAFRWVSLMLSQEFLLPDVIRLWDSLFADAKRFDFLLYVCLAMILDIRDQLLVNDFSTNMKMLQNYPITDVAGLTVLAQQLRNGENNSKKRATCWKSCLPAEPSDGINLKI